MEISLCMIVKNEEDVLERCLTCASKFADEIIVVDTGSTDKTKNIARKFTEHVYDFEWTENFAEARNFSLSKATKEYMMWLDADDVIDDANIEKILKLKENTPSYADVVMMKYNVSFDSGGMPNFSYYRERILKNNSSYFFEGAVHEAISVFGNIVYSDVEINHQKIKVNEPQRNLRIFRKILADGKELSPREQYYYARELFYNHFYFNAASQFNSFLEGNKGCINDNIEACSLLAQCYYKLSNEDKALQTLFKSFSYGVPRGELCCDIGQHFLDRNQCENAVFWYQTALRSKKETASGFFRKDCYDFIPYIQMCVCYDKLGDPEKAEEYNEKAGQIKPYDESYKFNKEYFRNKKERR